MSQKQGSRLKTHLEFFLHQRSAALTSLTF